MELFFDGFMMSVRKAAGDYSLSRTLGRISESRVMSTTPRHFTHSLVLTARETLSMEEQVLFLPEQVRALIEAEGDLASTETLLAMCAHGDSLTPSEIASASLLLRHNMLFNLGLLKRLRTERCASTLHLFFLSLRPPSYSISASVDFPCQKLFSTYWECWQNIPGALGKMSSRTCGLVTSTTNESSPSQGDLPRLQLTPPPQLYRMILVVPLISSLAQRPPPLSTRPMRTRTRNPLSQPTLRCGPRLPSSHFLILIQEAMEHAFVAASLGTWRVIGSAPAEVKEVEDEEAERRRSNSASSCPYLFTQVPPYSPFSLFLSTPGLDGSSC